MEDPPAPIPPPPGVDDEDVDPDFVPKPPDADRAIGEKGFDPTWDLKYDEDEEEGEYEVDLKALRDTGSTSIILIVFLVFWVVITIFFLVWLGLAANCQIEGICTTVDQSTNSDAGYLFETFPFIIPSVYIWAAMTAAALGYVVVCLYAINVIRQDCGTPRMVEIASYIREGSVEFLRREYAFLVILIIALLLLTGFGINWRLAVCLLIGAFLSGVTGYIGMSIATRGNVRTSAMSAIGIEDGLNIAFRSGAVMGLAVVSTGLGGLSASYLLLRDVRALAGFSAGASSVALFARVGGGIYTKAADVGADLIGKVEAGIPEDDPRNPATIADNVGDNVGDVAGMGADLFESYVGSIVATAILGASLPYYFSNSLALCVANHLYVDEICGPLGFPDGTSYAYFLCTVDDFYLSYPNLRTFGSVSMFVAFPFMMGCVGVLTACICTFYVRVPDLSKVKREHWNEKLLLALNLNIAVGAVFVLGGAAGLAWGFFGASSDFQNNLGFGDALLPRYVLSGDPETQCIPEENNIPAGASIGVDYYRPLDSLLYEYPAPVEVPWRLFLCVILGLLLGVSIGFLTEFSTSGGYWPTKSIAQSGEYGPGAVVIQGLGIGMLSTVAPMLLVLAVIIGTFALFSAYGIAVSAVGMLSTLGITMATDAYGPVADNAGGIAEMAELPPEVRETTDALDALGNTTAATGKGFSNGSAVLTAYALLTALIQDSGLAPDPIELTGTADELPAKILDDTIQISLTDIYVVGAVFVGIMLPYLFGALTMLAVSRAARAIMAEVRYQFNSVPGLREGKPGVRPNHRRCIAISTTSSIREMIAPGMIAILSPLIIGFAFGQQPLVGLLIAAIGSGYMMGILMSNAGGAWDNAKKLVESGYFGEENSKGSEWHKATVAGDTVGDPFKDTSGPSMNILIKLMTTVGLVAISLMRPDLSLWYVGLILFIVVVVLAAGLWWINGRDANKKMEEMKSMATDGQIKAPPKVVAKRATGRSVPIDEVVAGSAYDEALNAAGGVSAVNAGVNVDLTNLPGLRGFEDEPGQNEDVTINFDDVNDAPPDEARTRDGEV